MRNDILDRLKTGKPAEYDWEGQKVFVRTLTITDLRKLADTKDCPEENWIIAGVCDQDGKPLFTQEDINVLSESNVDLISLAQIVIDHNTKKKSSTMT